VKPRSFADRPVLSWTPAQALQHLRGTFDLAVRDHADLMEPFVVMLVEAAGDAARVDIMRSALRQTVAGRYDAPSKATASAIQHM